MWRATRNYRRRIAGKVASYAFGKRAPLALAAAEGVAGIARDYLSNKRAKVSGSEVMSYGQGTLTRSRRTYGRRAKPGSLRYAKLFAKNTAQRHVYGLSDYSTYGGPLGAIHLSNWFYPGVVEPFDAPRYYTPCHLWDVSSAPNNVGGTVTGAQCGYKLTFYGGADTDLGQWYSMFNVNSVIRSAHNVSSTASLPNASSMLTGVSAKLMFYAPQTLPVRINVALIQIQEPKYHPPKGTAGGWEDVGAWNADDTALGQMDVSATAFWQNVVQSFCKNPVITTDGATVNKNLRVLKKHSFILNPKESTDASSTTYHQYNFYHKFNRLMRYDWQDQDRVNMIQDDAQFIEYQENKCCVEPRARLYLMITADSVYNGPNVPAENTGLTEVTAGCPSYDIALRMYHVDGGS